MKNFEIGNAMNIFRGYYYVNLTEEAIYSFYLTISIDFNLLYVRA